MNIDVGLGGLVGGLNIKELNQRQDISFNLKGSDLDGGNNTIKLKVGYKDKLKRPYSVKSDIIIELEKVSFFQKIIIILKGLNRFIKNVIT